LRVPIYEQQVPPSDGRRARGQRTQLRVLEALLKLVEEGDLRPTALAVAERADVSLRTVYHHFADIDAVRFQALELQRSRAQKWFRPIDSTLSVEQRAKIFAHQCRLVFEGITPIRRATLFDDFGSEQLLARGRRARALRRSHLVATFPEIVSPSGTDQLLDAADTATCWLVWNYQRESLRRSAAGAEALITSLLTSLLA
jgi:TetR/AcrR family transcriptional regulator of autoinduction and epiphytic fitness